MRSRAGFTLIELSIVLVIIGLVVGGILVGRELIVAAELRASISQLEKYKAAVNTFRLKYGWLPGDIPASKSSALGFFTLTNAGVGTQGNQDGNWLIENSTTLFSGEIAIFWRHLSEASLVDGSFGMRGNAQIDPSTATYMGATLEGEMGNAIPAFKLARGNYVAAYPYNSKNTFLVHGFVNAPGGMAAGQYRITPIEAAEIDRKMDDGAPATGKVLEYTYLVMGFNTCTTSGTPRYDVGSTNGNTPLCSLMVLY